MIAYKEGTNFFSDLFGDEIDNLVKPEAIKGELEWEKSLTAGQGWAYGAEFLVRKTAGKFTGWIGYTLSWTIQQFDELNFGKKFYARYDRRHDISVVLMYDISKRVSLSAAWTYSSGNVVTLPESVYNWENMWHNIGNYLMDKYGMTSDNLDMYDWWYYYDNRYPLESYGERNNMRMQAFHHLDVGIQIKIKDKPKRKWEGMWDVSIYNVYNHKNAFFYFVDVEDYLAENPKYVLKKICIFPIIPSVSFNFKF